MKSIQRFNLMITFYLAALSFMLLCVLAVPVSIRWDLSITKNFIIKEDIFETILMVVLFAISFFIFLRFKHALKSYEQKFSRAEWEKSRLLSRLTDSFRYIGTVNVELQEIHTILKTLDQYPRTVKDFKKIAYFLTTSTMTIAKTAWASVRIIDKESARTISEYTVSRPGYAIPTNAIGNAEILEQRTACGVQYLVNDKKNVDLITVCILPLTDTQTSEEEKTLLKLIIDLIEMYFLLSKADYFPGISKSVTPAMVKNELDAMASPG